MARPATSIMTALPTSRNINREPARPTAWCETIPSYACGCTDPGDRGERLYDDPTQAYAHFQNRSWGNGGFPAASHSPGFWRRHRAHHKHYGRNPEHQRQQLTGL